MKSIFALLLAVGFAPVALADQCFYVSAGAGQDVNRVEYRTLSGRTGILSIKLMGPNLEEIRTFACTYAAENVSDATTHAYRVGARRNPSCAGSIDVAAGAVVSIEITANETATQVNGIATHAASVTDSGVRSYWAHPCADVDARR